MLTLEQLATMLSDNTYCKVKVVGYDNPFVGEMTEEFAATVTAFVGRHLYVRKIEPLYHARTLYIVAR